ncbi:hypothetical protein DERF_014333 [Dermatophagoides farinae]|uniref:Uncharacterized protein n=1 Tax=Dermatophagoides farinae TaxID=6954 RepID=A0A922HHK7_DERFA|nr:hypothetical protein DERF_014333 [Dermatophagoides farinae]
MAKDMITVNLFIDMLMISKKAHNNNSVTHTSSKEKRRSSIGKKNPKS